MDVVYVPLSQRISNTFVEKVLIAFCFSVDIIARIEGSLKLFLSIFQSMLIPYHETPERVSAINRSAVWEMRKWSYAIGGNMVTKNRKGLFTRYDFVACDKLTTGLRHELFRVNQTYNS